MNDLGGALLVAHTVEAEEVTTCVTTDKLSSQESNNPE